MKVNKSDFNNTVIPVKAVALGKKLSAAYLSIPQFCGLFETLEYINEHKCEGVDDVLDKISESNCDVVIMPNPYGNKRRNLVYKELKKLNFPVITFDRGGLPGSWYFDKGFNADSPTYSPLMWDQKISAEESDSVKKYIEDIHLNGHALEAQSKLLGGEQLKRKLGLYDKKILFVPFQRPKDTTVEYFSGSVKDMNEFNMRIEKIAKLLNTHDSDWVVIGKKHPLENTKVNSSIRYVEDDTHINDLIEASDAVCLINSGVGLLSMLWDKPVYHFGEVYYAHPSLNRRVHNEIDVVHSLLKCPVKFEPVVRDRFISYLIKHVYSFGEFSTELVREGNAFRNITRNIDFENITLPSYPCLDANKKKILFVSSVIPIPVNRGSAVRTNQMLLNLVKEGYLIDCVFVNMSYPKETSKDIKARIKAAYPLVNNVTVRKHPKFSKGYQKFKYNIGTLFDIFFRRDQEITNTKECPGELSRLVRSFAKDVNYDGFFINYLKLIKSVPESKLSKTIVDIHDFQSHRIANDVLPTLPKRKQNSYLENFQRSEIKLLKKANKVVSISSTETKHLKNILPNLNILTVPAACEKNYSSSENIFEYELAFIGSNSDANRDSILWFLDNVFPFIVEQHRNIKLLIQGNVTRNKLLLNNANFQKYIGKKNIVAGGFVQDLGEVYAKSEIIICPIIKGTGMKIKVAEALSHSKAIIGTDIAFEGYELNDGENMMLANSKDEFVNAVNILLNNKPLYHQLCYQARKVHEDKYDLTSYSNVLREFIEND